NEAEEVEGWFVEWSLMVEENSALYLTNFKEVPVSDDNSELVNSNELTIEQQQQAQEFLLAKMDMFAQELDEL
ncbi:22801_t:CDS:2, partial [Gigaspora margarita]